MSNIDKTTTNLDANQVLKKSFNDSDATLSTSTFLTAKAGNKITLTISTTDIANDTETYSYFDGVNLLYTIKVIYTDGDRTQMISAERTI